LRQLFPAAGGGGFKAALQLYWHAAGRNVGEFKVYPVGFYPTGFSVSDICPDPVRGNIPTKLLINDMGPILRTILTVSGGSAANMISFIISGNCRKITDMLTDDKLNSTFIALFLTLIALAMPAITLHFSINFLSGFCLVIMHFISWIAIAVFIVAVIKSILLYQLTKDKK
jgi:hypothetical protein